MDHPQTRAGGAAPPGSRPRYITLEQIPRFGELYRKTGRPPRIYVKRPCRFTAIHLPTGERWELALSDGRTYLLEPGANPLEPPLVLPAGAWFRLRQPAGSTAQPPRPVKVRFPECTSSGWGDELFDSLLSDAHEQTGDEAASARPAGTPSVALEPPVPAFTFGRPPRADSLLARFRRRVLGSGA